MNKTNLPLKIMREVSLKADSFYDRAEQLGAIAAANLKDEHRSQVTNLESIANSAMKVSDVLNYLKTQTARRDYWREDGLGPALLKFVGVDLNQDKRLICETLDLPVDSSEAQHIHLYLIREFVRQFAAQYEYQAQQAKSGSHASHT